MASARTLKIFLFGAALEINKEELITRLSSFTVLHVSPFDQSISGSDESLLDLVAGLGEAGIESFVALPKSSPYCGRYIRAGAKLMQMPMASIKRTYNPLRWAGLAYSAVEGASIIANVVRATSIDIIHTNMETVPAGMMAARKASRPSVVHVRSTSIKRPRWVFRRLVNFLGRHSDRAVAISDAVYNLLAEAGYPPERLSRIYDPVNTAIYRPRSKGELDELFDEKFKPLGIEKGCPCIGLVGRMNPIKGQRVFLEAAPLISGKHPGARFILIGDAADDRERRYEGELHGLARRLGIEGRVHFMGHRSDIAGLLPLLNISVSPSTTEAFGRPAAESMACGTPVVASAIDGLKEIVEDGETGLLARSTDARSLAEAMDKLLSDPALASRMGANGRKRVMEHFSCETHCNQMTQLFKSLL